MSSSPPLAPPRVSPPPSETIRADASTLWPGVVVWTIVSLCCVLPVCWIVVILLSNRASLVELHLDSFRIHLIARTIGYNLIVALIATLLAIPAAIVLGRGRGILARLLWFILPISLLIPSLTFTYGWKQALRLCGFDDIAPAGALDVARCIWSLATWLWPVPAVVMGMSLRRFDVNVQQQAQLDGASARVIARHLLAPAIAASAIVAALAMQEFAVYEPTGISVIATETRMVFETGAFSSPDNPITQPMGSGFGFDKLTAGGVQGSGKVTKRNNASDGSAPAPSPGTPGEGGGEGLSRATTTNTTTNPAATKTLSPALSLSTERGSESIFQQQPARAAAAVATCLPMLGVVAILSVIALLGIRKLSSADTIEFGAWPGSLDARFRTIALAWTIVIVTLVLPIFALVKSHKGAIDPAFVWDEFGPEVLGTILVGAISGAVAMILSLLASIRPRRLPFAAALLSFLVGGQLIAIALIRLYNHGPTIWLYESALPVTMAYVARFGWIVLFAALGTFSAPWQAMRDVAAVDGANEFAAARYIIWPLAWPVLGASALFVATLSLSEVPATVLLAPQRPQVLVPLMMTWVHALRSDPMIEASLVTAALVVVIGAVGVLLWWVGARRNSQITNRNSQRISKTRKFKLQNSALFVSCVLCVVSSFACDARHEPKEIWLETGGAAGQVVYPRGITYSPSDDTFFIVDRAAHVQHLDHEGKFLNDWHMPLAQQGKPVGLSVGPDGNLWVPDTHYHRVIVYSPQGKILRQWGGRGTEPGQFIYPTDIAFDSKGNVFVSEYGDNDRVQVFDHDLKFLYSFGKFGAGDGEFSRPQSMVIDGDFVYITDACNHRINVFKTDGTFVRNMGSVGTAPGKFRFPYGLDIDKDGDLIVCEFGNNRVQKIDKKTGQCKAIWGRPGRQPGEFAYPWGVCVDKRDRIIAVDAGNNRVQVFEF